MRSCIPPVVVCLAVLFSCAHGPYIPPPTLEPRPDDDAVRTLVMKGIDLHDRGDYDAAIIAYDAALEINPASPFAWYELSMSLFSARRFEASLDAALHAARYENDFMHLVYVSAGNALSRLERWNESERVFREGMERFPDFHLLPFNLATMFFRRGDSAEAMRFTQESARLDPLHASSHYAIGDFYFMANRRVPSILAFSLFLCLESETRRANSALGKIRWMIGGGVYRESDSAMKIMFSDLPEDGVDDFGAVEMGLSMATALEKAGGNGDRPKAEELVRQLDTVFGLVAELASDGKDRKPGFAWECYAPFVRAAVEAGHRDAMSRVILGNAGLPGADAWTAEHRTASRAFIDWTRRYLGRPPRTRKAGK
ncbi:MAG: tetratricopeptide repeat protein [Candidatus Krumholzibacteriota bacterium]|nr:tetratricopeptide repeat protein [Candidatus Krumholzibacteriota bacterium]